MGTGVNASGFTPIDFTYKRKTKDGDISQITYLIGSHFNERKDGVVTGSTTGPMENNTTIFSGGKLELAGDSDVTEAIASNNATHSTFMYFYEKTRIQGNSEIAVAQVGEKTPTNKFVHRMRTTFVDLATTDELIIDLEAGNSVSNTDPEFLIKQIKGGTETTLATFTLPTGNTSIDWEIRFREDGLTKISYKTITEKPVVLFRGDITADIAECKVVHKFMTEEDTPTRTVKTDFLWIYYPAIFSGYDIDFDDKSKGIIKIWDQNNTETESEWLRVRTKTHKFVGERVVENGLIRMRFKSTPELELYGWDNTSSIWSYLGSILPENDNGDLASTLHDVIIETFTKSEAEIIAKWGILDYRINFRKGLPWVRILLNSKELTFKTTKARFALSANTEATNLTKWNQLGSDDTDRGNPLGTYQGATNPQIFTEDNNVDTGLNHIDDNWFAFYDKLSTDIVAWIGSLLIPVTLEVEATSTSALKEVRFGWRQRNYINIGYLESDMVTTINGIPKGFFAGTDDTYVKWRANGSIFDMRQRPFVRKRR